MPPRKRAESKPADPETETEPQTDDAGVAPEATPEEPPAPAAPDKPKKSDLQAAEQPCPICIPNGWTEGAFSMGCEHGTWVRDNA